MEKVVKDDDDNNDEKSDDYEVGYRKPPRKHQFKKGRSGCPDGGWATRRERKRAREANEIDELRQRERDVQNILRRAVLQEHEVQTPDGPQRMTRLHILVERILTKAIQKDATDKDRRHAMALIDKLGFLDKLDLQRNQGVLVVYPILPQDEWIKQTEGELLPKDPLHGIPGAEGLLSDHETPKRKGPPDDDID